MVIATFNWICFTADLKYHTNSVFYLQLQLYKLQNRADWIFTKWIVYSKRNDLILCARKYLHRKVNGTKYSRIYHSWFSDVLTNNSKWVVFVKKNDANFISLYSVIDTLYDFLLISFYYNIVIKFKTCDRLRTMTLML